MAELPRGTVTLVFTDIEGSTRLLENLGESYGEVLSEHRRLLRAAFSSHGGIEVDTQGDAFFFALARAHDAISAAVEAQQALASHPWAANTEVRVRMGIHTGEPVLSGEGYVGQDVHRAARICSAAHGGQVLVSEATARLLESGRGITLRDLGSHGLKDLKDPEHLYQLVISSLRENFPALRSLDARPNNLPRQITPVVGREQEIKSGSRLLLGENTALLSLTGPGGTGKTRLALALGQELLDSFADGVFFVDLSAISDPSLVVPAVAQTLFLKESGTKGIAETLFDHLAGKEMLLILDNFEQVIEAAPEVSSLLASARGLKILVTTREPLQVRGERELEVPPLELPPPGPQVLENLANSPAVALFCERAGAVKASFELTESNAVPVAEICRRLDGLPLALELAAARIRTMSPSSLLARLDRSLEVLTGGARDLAERQRTLRGAISWSYDLLDEDERRLFCRLGVFSGGFTTDAAAAVANRGDLSIPIWEGLSSLVDKSLVRLNDTDEDRFSMLETIREFAQEKLEGVGEAEDIRRAHAEFFRAQAEEAWHNLVGQHESFWLYALETERDNLRVAIQEGIAHNSDVALSLTGSLWRFWWARGYLSEGRALLEAALNCESPSAELRARALRGLAAIALAQGDILAATKSVDYAARLFSQLGDRAGLARCFETRGLLAEERGDLAAARSHFSESQELYEAIGDEAGVSTAVANLSNVALLAGDFEKAYGLARRSVEIDERLGHREGVAGSLLNMGFAALEQGERDHASQLISKGLGIAREVDHKELVAIGVEASAALAATKDDIESAAKLLAEADGLREASGHAREAFERKLYERTIAYVRARRGSGATGQ